VLHWHVVDTQSFPFESSTYPKLWQGAYTKPERYSQNDIRELVEYGRKRGVKVMIEFDMPGHAASWCTGYPEICPSMSCKQPLNPASNLTFPLITSLLGECTGANTKPSDALFPYDLLHLGGDEVSYTCWESSAQIQECQKEQGFSTSEDTYKYFVDKAATITREQNRLPIQWVEVFEHFGDKLDKNTVVHVWKEKTTLDGVLKAGYRALLSNQDDWYLE
jgi:hexosaminidase